MMNTALACSPALRAAYPELRIVRDHVVHRRSADLFLDPGFPYGEELLQYIWEQRLFDQHALRTTAGLEVDVLRPGRIQPNSGPDLSGAEVRIAGQVWAGTVEVHLRSSEWNAHGHQYDPAYENVVLHVVYEHDAEVRTLNGRVLPTIELLSRVSTDSIAMHHALMRGKGFVPCSGHVGRIDHSLTGTWLERVLIERFERKSAEVERVYRQLDGDPSATLFHMLCRAFGLKVNAEPFGMLAHALPLRILQRYRDDALRMEALLFGQAGLLQVDFVDEHPRALQAEYAHLVRMHELRPAPVAAWKFGRMRPVNFPTVRIAQLANLLMRMDGSFAALLQAEDVGSLHQLLDVEAGPYWSTHFVFDRESAPCPKRLGRAGADHLIINALVPTLFALGHMQGRQALVERAISLLEQMPAENNRVLQGWGELGLRADSAARGQALIELRNTYCSAKRCLSCGIGNQLLKRTV